MKYNANYKTIILLLINLFAITINVSGQDANKLYLNMDQSYESKQDVYNFLKSNPDNYYVIFSTHDAYSDPKSPKDNSIAGHAWIMWGHENPQTKSSEISGFGFWPDRKLIENTVSENIANALIASTAISSAISQLVDLTTPGKIVHASLKLDKNGLTGVPGVLQEDLFGLTYSKSLKQIVVKVDKETYQKSLKVLDDYKTKKPDYKLMENDCVSFFIEVGDAIGFDMPKRSIANPSSLKPSNYMDLFFKNILFPSKMGIHYQYRSMLIKKYGNVSADLNGSYNIVFGINQENKNTCELDYAGNRFEKTIRDNKLMCSTTNYSNGEYWYQEYEARPIPAEHAGIPGVMPPKPISEYWYANGNYIIGFGQNPTGFNPNYVNMNLSKKNTQYSGTINNLGEPNGLGTISHFGNIVNGQFQNNIQTGKFIDGKFIEHTGVSFEKALVYGDFVNGQLTGKGRIEYYDNKVFTGTFDKGLANGNCTYVDNNTGEYYSGFFKDGYMNGYGIHKNQSGLYKGNFINGKACGLGIAQTPNGSVCEGNFENGGFKNGKLTTPNGNYYIGNFDSKGNPTGGKYYDKNGKEITERETHGNERDKDGNGKILVGWQIGDGPFVEENWGLDINGK